MNASIGIDSQKKSKGAAVGESNHADKPDGVNVQELVFTTLNRQVFGKGKVHRPLQR